MNLRPALGGWQIPHIEHIEALERRNFAQFDVPGRAGGLYQDLNSTPMRIAISGSLYGDEARDSFLGEVRGKFQSGEPVTFVADIVTATELQYVLIETMAFEEGGGRPDELGYNLVLRESPPPPPPDPLGGLDAGLLEQAEGFADTVNGALDVIEGLGSVPDIGDPTPRLSGALDEVTTATEGLGGALGPLRDVFGTDEP